MQREVVDRGSDSGGMEAGLQTDIGALLLEMTGTEVLEGGANWPFVPPSELTSQAGDIFFGRSHFVLTSNLLLLPLLAAFRSLILKPCLYPGLRQVGFQHQLLPHEDVWVPSLSKQCFQHIQLHSGERCPLLPLFPRGGRVGQ